MTGFNANLKLNRPLLGRNEKKKKNTLKIIISGEAVLASWCNNLCVLPGTHWVTVWAAEAKKHARKNIKCYLKLTLKDFKTRHHGPSINA